jgi:hypothetical protein
MANEILMNKSARGAVATNSFWEKIAQVAFLAALYFAVSAIIAHILSYRHFRFNYWLGWRQR